MRDDTAPSIDLDWEERLFRAVRGLWKHLAPRRERPPGTGAAFLAADAGALATLASILAGHPLKIEAGASVGGLRGDVLLLPHHIDVDDDPAANRNVLVVRVCIAATLFRQGAVLRPGTSSGRQILETLAAVGRATTALRAELPGFGARFDAARQRVLAARPALALRGRQSRIEALRRAALADEWPRDLDALEAELSRLRDRGPASPGVVLWGELLQSPGAAGEAAAPDETAHAPATGRELEIRPPEHVERKDLDTNAEFNPALHSFEKVETLDDHAGGVRHTDGSDQLDEQLEALEELSMSEVIRGGEPAEAILRADLQLGGDIPDVARLEPDEQGISYDEWDGRKRRYRPDWCTVYPTPVVARDPGWAQPVLRARARQIDELERRLRRHRSRLAAQNRQRDGEEVDLDAVVRARAAARAGDCTDDRLYIRRERQRRDFATTVLVDISLSTDSWIANRRVLDIAREAVLVLGEVSCRLHDRLRLLAFASHTRNICRVWELHGWSEPWQVARDRLGLLRPQGYTRIGPALRHATADLAAVAADHRLLLLVSDGKPTDYDRYEGRYGMADIRQALREAARAGIHAHALAIDTRAKSYLSTTFGVGGWDILPDPERLPRVMTEVYGRLTG